MEVIGESSNETKSVLQEVADERYRQDGKWGEQNHPDGTGSALYVDAANAARERCDTAAKEGKLTFAHILDEEFWEAMAEADRKTLRQELVQVAAVAVAWIEKIDRDIAKEERTDASKT